MRRAIQLVCAMVAIGMIAACTDSSPVGTVNDDVERAPAQLSSSALVDLVLESLNHTPVAGAIWGVPDEGRTPDAAIVVYADAHERVDYRVARMGEGWALDGVTSRVRLDDGSDRAENGYRDAGLASSVSCPNGKLVEYKLSGGGVLVTQCWNGIGLPPGEYMVTHQFSAVRPAFLRGFDQSVTRNDSTISVSPSRVETCYPGIGICPWREFLVFPEFDRDLRDFSDTPDEARYWYDLDVDLPDIDASIDGPTSVTITGSQTWTADLGFEQGTESYIWQVYDDDNEEWETRATTESYTSFLGPSSDNFTMRLIVNRSADSASDTTTVTVTVDIDLPSVTISGPTNITSGGTYDWTAVVPDSSGLETDWLWETRDAGSSTWQTLATTPFEASRTIGASTPNFDLRVSYRLDQTGYTASDQIAVTVDISGGSGSSGSCEEGGEGGEGSGGGEGGEGGECGEGGGSTQAARGPVVKPGGSGGLPK